MNIIISVSLAFVSSILLFLVYPKPGINWLVWISFIPLFIALENKNKKQSFKISYTFGFLFWTVSIYWVSYVTVLGDIFLVLYLSLYFGLFGLFFTFITKSRKKNKFIYVINFLSIPCFWVLLEYIRSHFLTGFGWSLLGYSQYKNLPVIQISDITGAYGVSFLIVLVNITLFYLIKTGSNFLSKNDHSRNLNTQIINSVIYILITAVCLGGVLYYGNYKLNLKENKSFDSLRISVIQGNFPAQQKWMKGRTDRILEKYIDSTYKASSKNTDLIIWPETAVPIYLNKEEKIKKIIADTAQKIETPLLIGTPWMKNGSYYNSTVLFSKKGKMIDRYEKVHLVPFGEYLPFGEYFPSIVEKFQIGNYKAGDSYTVLELPGARITEGGVKFSVLICYEDIFSHLVREFTNRDIDFLVNVTDDSWFGDTGATFQHMQALVFRAIENKVSAVRATNTGFSCFISPVGRIFGSVKDETGKELFVSGYNTESIKIVDKITFYQKYGNMFVYFCIFIVLISLILPLLAKDK